MTQLLRQEDAKVFKKYSQMKLQMKREALQKLNRAANEAIVSGQTQSSGTVSAQLSPQKRSGAVVAPLETQ